MSSAASALVIHFGKNVFASELDQQGIAERCFTAMARGFAALSYR